MKRINSIKIAVVTVVAAIGLIGFAWAPKSEMQTVKTIKTPAKIIKGKDKVAGYKSWTKVSKSNFVMDSVVSTACAAAVREFLQLGSNLENSPHKDKYINVYVNAIGEGEMLTKKNPKFPVGTVVVKEKLVAPDSLSPELLTVMIKRQKGFNPEVGDWEFMTLNGQATEVTSKGKLASCQSCHLDYKQNDFITRTYLPEEFKRKLK